MAVSAVRRLAFFFTRNDWEARSNASQTVAGRLCPFSKDQNELNTPLSVSLCLRESKNGAAHPQK